MDRLLRTDAVLDSLNDERDHIAIQISLLSEAEKDPAKLKALQQELENLERRIFRYRPA